MSAEITQLVNRRAVSDRAATERLMGLVYDDFRSLAQRLLKSERGGHTLQATDLVNEAFLKLVNQTEVTWQGRTHFFAIGAQAMRRILVDHARGKHRHKRGGKRKRVALRDDQVLTVDDPDDILALNDAIDRLSALNADHARMVECRFFGGMGNSEIAQLLGVTSRTIERYWVIVRAWLRRELDRRDPP